MIPEASSQLKHIATRMRHDLVDMASDSYLKAELKLLAQLLDMLAIDHDRSVSVLTMDILDLEDIITRSLPLIPAELRYHADLVVKNRVTTNYVGDLQQRSDMLTKILIQVHDYLASDQARDAADESLLTEIWQFLEEQVNRHSY